MEGCLSTLIKLMILGGLFVLGLVGGYFYYVGFFDPQLVKFALDGMPKIKVEEAIPLIDATATPEAAFTNPAATDKKWVRWRGSISETRSIAPDLTQLTLLTSSAPRRTVVVFVDHQRAPIDGRVSDEIEVIGWSRRTLVLSEDREGHRYPQVLALKVTKLTPVVPASAASTDADGELTAHGAESMPEPSPSPSAAAPAPVANAAPPPSTHAPAPAPHSSHAASPHPRPVAPGKTGPP